MKLSFRFRAFVVNRYRSAYLKLAESSTRRPRKSDLRAGKSFAFWNLSLPRVRDVPVSLLIQRGVTRGVIS
jgi:hypothetical protein